MVAAGQDWIGRTLARTYHVEQLLGRGGMGLVFRVRHLRTGGKLAIKMLHREAAAEPDIYKRFQDEARIVSALSHPHIIQVTDFDQEGDTPFMVMELLEGEDLHHRLRQVGRLQLQATLEIARQVGTALQAAHDSGVVHRDVKPQNIFLSRHRTAEEWIEVAKVVDFGISKIRRSESQITRDQTILGTPHFMSPEVARGNNQGLDGRADQWSLGVILYRALSGVLPFNASDMVGVLYQVVHEQPVPLGQLAPGLPQHVVAAIERAMAKDRDHRFPNMNTFVRALSGQPISGVQVPVSASRPTVPQSATTLPEPAQTTTLSSATGHHVPAKGRRRALLGVGAVALGGLVLTGVLLRGPGPEGPATPVAAVGAAQPAAAGGEKAPATAAVPAATTPAATTPTAGAAGRVTPRPVGDLPLRGPAAGDPAGPTGAAATPTEPPTGRGVRTRRVPSRRGKDSRDGRDGKEPARRPGLDPGV